MHKIRDLADTTSEVKRMNNIPDQQELPMGFSMALAQNLRAMQRFSSLPEGRQQQIVALARSVTSKQEMDMFVSNLLL